MKSLSKLAAALLAVLFAAGTAYAETINWNMANEYNDTSIHAEGDKFFSKTLEEKSGGKIRITHHFGGSIGFKSKDQLDAVGDGALPIADTFVGPLGGINPMFLLPSVPFLAQNPEEARRLYEIAKPEYEAVFAANNQILLYASPWPPSGFWANKAIDGSEALKGLKIRTYDANGTVTLKEAGASPIQLSWADVVPQLSTGGISGVLTSAESGTNGKFWEHLSHFTEVNYAMPLNMVHINKEVFGALPADLQKAVLEAAKLTEERQWKAVVDRVAQNYADMKANKVVVVETVPAEFLASLRTAGKKALESWLEKTGDKGAAIMKQYNGG